MKRCEWATSSEAMCLYHDREWGVPKTSDIDLFEMLVLEGAQAGLSWSSILNRREGYRRAFAGFDPVRVARFSSRKVEGLLRNPQIIRNRKKIDSAIMNARAFKRIQREHGSFSSFIWQFVGGVPVQNQWKTPSDIPAKSGVSKEMSTVLRKLGFSFVGPTICYAFMQAVGMVNDHEVGCFRHRQVKSIRIRV